MAWKNGEKCEECGSEANLERVSDGLVDFILCDNCKNEYYTVINNRNGIDICQLNRM